MDRVCSMNEGDKMCSRFSRKPEQKTPLARLRQRWKDNIKMGSEETGCENVEWIHLG
jgi:hypothetical protein